MSLMRNGHRKLELARAAIFAAVERIDWEDVIGLDSSISEADGDEIVDLVRAANVEVSF